jgi:hypothetical protein
MAIPARLENSTTTWRDIDRLSKQGAARVAL